MKYPLILTLAATVTTQVAQAQYSFAPQIQSTNTASITFNSGTGVFQYVASPNLSADYAGLPLTGAVGALITPSNEWTASLTAALSASSLPGNVSNVYAGIGLYIVVNNNPANTASIALLQENDTGVGVFGNFYGAAVVFQALTNNQQLATTPLGQSDDVVGQSYQIFSGGSNSSPTTESVDAASAVLSLTNDALTETLTGYCNGSPVGSLSLGSWGPNASLFLAVVGISQYGATVLEGTDTASNFSAGSYVAVATTTLPNATNSVVYSQALSAVGGLEPYSWTKSSGVLPPGLNVTTNGIITGTPTTNGTFNFTVRVTDATDSAATRSETLTVLSPPIVALEPTNTSVMVAPGGEVTLAVSVGGTPPFTYQWQFNGSNLPASTITTVAGNGGEDYSGDGGPATDAQFNIPIGVALDTAGDLFIADIYNNRIREVGSNGIIYTVAGGGTNSAEGVPATSDGLAYPTAVTVDAAGNFFIADNLSENVSKVGTNGLFYNVAGNGIPTYSGDGGPGTSASLWAPSGLAVDAAGDLFIADALNNRIRRVGTNGIITTVVGNGARGYFGDGGAATNAKLNQPTGVAVDAAGNLFIADSGNNVIRKVDADGKITTLAGNANAGYSGDGGPAIHAEFNLPHAVALDLFGNLFIADENNDLIRKVDTQGTVTTVAGIDREAGNPGFSGDGGVATNAALSSPTSVAVSGAGNLFIADEENLRVRKVDFAGPALALQEIAPANAGAYDVVVSGPYGAVTSSVVNLVIGSLPQITLSTPQITAGKTDFTFLLNGPSGGNYVLQVSSNLLNWSTISASAIPVGGSILLTNAVTSDKRSFYRAYLP